MFVCGISSYLIIDTKEVLPHDPCSIAGLASLLAGSSMCEESTLSEGREDRIVYESLWNSRLFGLGFWSSSEGRARFGIDFTDAQWKLQETGSDRTKFRL